MRARYARRRTALVDALARHAPAVELTGLAAGFHAVAHLPDGVDEPRVVAEAARARVGLYGMSGFRVDGHRPAAARARLRQPRRPGGAEGIATVADLLTP